MKLFGRLLEGQPDRLVGYRKERILIKVDTTAEDGGTEEQVIIFRTGDDADFIEGIVLNITDGELISADKYETEDYKRIQVTLQSGKQSWVYVKKDVQ